MRLRFPFHAMGYVSQKPDTPLGVGLCACPFDFVGAARSRVGLIGRVCVVLVRETRIRSVDDRRVDDQENSKDLQDRLAEPAPVRRDNVSPLQVDIDQPHDIRVVLG